jgi:hypothetical protein
VKKSVFKYLFKIISKKVINKEKIIKLSILINKTKKAGIIKIIFVFKANLLLFKTNKLLKKLDFSKSKKINGKKTSHNKIIGAKYRIAFIFEVMKI